MHTLVFLIHVAVGLISSSGYQILSQNKENKHAKEVPGCQGIGTCRQYQSSRAVDGDIDTCTRTAPFGTTTPDKWTWWYVDLEKVLSIFSIRIQVRDYEEQYVMRQRGRFAGFSLYVSNTHIKEDGYLCYKNGQELPTLDFSTTCVKHGRYIIFYNERLDGTTYPTGYETGSVHTQLCEVTVTGCEESGVFGYNCDVPCPSNCQEMRCDIVHGTCLGCTAGWVGEFCNTSCPAGYYGLQCRSTCSGHCRDNLSCNHTTGQCDYGCGNGWTGVHCNTQCPAESYGPDCMYNCSGQCLSYRPCNRTTGRCDGGCNPGYTGELCDKECPPETYGPNCLYICGERCLSDLPCNSTTGIRDGYCNAGYTGEPIDKGCKESGVYGYNCDLHCPNNCQELRCDIVHGTCLGCTAGWVEEFCNTSCPAGYYGLQCRSTCTGHCRDNLSCNNTVGQCDYGCGNGWTGIHCNTQCPVESYGPDCVYNCSGQCLSYLPCNRTTGRCDGGCNPGYTGELCDEVGRYGLNCSESCSSHCRSESNHCNHIDGHCEHGFDNGFQGSKCEKTCDKRSYGINCSQNCSQNCLGFCDNVGGSCICSSGWMESPGCSEKAPIVSNDEYSTPHAYIAALSISLVINFSFVLVIVILLRLLYNRKQEKCSSDYVTSVEISPPSQVSDNDVHQYQELNMAQ